MAPMRCVWSAWMDKFGDMRVDVPRGSPCRVSRFFCGAVATDIAVETFEHIVQFLQRGGSSHHSTCFFSTAKQNNLFAPTRNSSALFLLGSIRSNNLLHVVWNPAGGGREANGASVYHHAKRVHRRRCVRFHCGSEAECLVFQLEPSHSETTSCNCRESVRLSAFSTSGARSLGARQIERGREMH